MANNVVFGALLLILAEICFAGLSGLVKLYSETLTQAQIVFFRNLFAFIVLLPLLGKHPLKKIRTYHFRWHLYRACTGLIAMYCFVYVIATIPLAQATLVVMMSPFIIPVVALLWLKEKIHLTTALAIAIGFAGVCVFLELGVMPFQPVLILALAAACLVATTKVMLRRMSSTESAFSIIFYFALLSTLVSAIPVFWYWQPLNVENTLGLVLMGALASAGQWLMTKAFAVAPAGKIGLFGYSSIIFAGLLGLIFWQEPFALMQIIGTAIIILAGYLALHGSAKASGKRESTQ